MEVKDTYYIGTNAAYVNVLDMCSDGQNLYAATANGIYTASMTAPNLANFTYWSVLHGGSGITLPLGTYNQIASFNGKTYFNFSKNMTSGTYQQDTVYSYDPALNQWARFESQMDCHSIRAAYGYLLTAHNGDVIVYDGGLNKVNIVFGTPFGGFAVNAAIKGSGGLDIYTADHFMGLVYSINSYKATSYAPNGPHKPDVFAMAYSNGTISLAPGSHADNWGNRYNNAGLSTFINEEWATNDYTNYPILGTDFDFISTAIDPSNPKHILYGSLGFGVFEFLGGNLSTIYNYHHGNCSLKPRSVSDTMTWVGGMNFDPAGNLWVTNLFTNDLLHCREPNGTWHAFDCSSIIGNVEVGNVIVGQNGIKWAILPRGRGILLYDDRGTLSNPNDDRIKQLIFTKGKGALSGTDVYSIIEDKNQQIWVGTDAGICVFYNPDNMFANTGYDAQQILIQQGVHVQILMETQTVTALAVDGANRKWIGTASGGAFLMSADGTQQIYNFNKDNSPLLSNNINAITINGKTGEVFFGTDQGVVSFRSTATEGGDSFSDVYAFPNPVKHDYEGPIAIKGLTTNAEVKITDISGELIYQTKALGGQALWDGKNFKGERARTGVYIVFCSDTDGKQTLITKILFIN
jgi:hypothetical protein